MDNRMGVSDLILLVSVSCMLSDVACVSKHPLLMIIIYDGFRWDYLDMVRSHNYKHTPNFDFLKKSGIQATHVQNVFPTVTMASHMSILTGLYPESHGVVANNFYDPSLQKWYHMKNAEDNLHSEYFDTGGETIWVTNQKSSSDRFSGSTLMPTTLTAIKGMNVTYGIHSELFNRNITYKKRVDAMISWFMHPEYPINLGLFYLGEPDDIAHHHGPESVEVLDNIVALDNKTGYLLQQLEQHGLLEKMNLIFTADHGMTYISKHRLIYIDDFLDRSKYNSSNLGSLGLITPKPGLEQHVFNKLKLMQTKHPQFKVYWKNDSAPELQALHYCNNDRIDPIVIIPDLGWYFIHRNETPVVANHGFNNSASDMWPFFIASGPAFRENSQSDFVHQVDIYALMCHILGVTPAPNNGSLHRIRHILKPQSAYSLYVSTILTYLLLVALCLSISFIMCWAAFRMRHSYNRVTWRDDLNLRDQEEGLLSDEDL